MILTQKQVADLFDVQVAAVSKMYKRGMPALPDKVNGKISFDSKAIIDWYAKNQYGADDTLSLAQEKAKLAKIQAEKIEYDLKIKKGEYILASKVETIWSNILISLKTKLLNIPKSITNFYDGIDSANKLEMLLTREIESALNDLSKR